MSKHIDFENVTDEDVPYLLHRPWLADQIVYEGHTLPDSFYEAKGEVPPDNSWHHITDNGDQTADPPGSDAGKPLDEEDDEEIEDSYDAWNVEQLKAELHERELTVGGTKAELIERLREDDAADEAEDEEEDDESEATE